MKDADNKIRIIVKGVDKTDEIIEFNDLGEKIIITYSDNKSYKYNKENVEIEIPTIEAKDHYNLFLYLKRLAKITGVMTGSEPNSDKNLLIPQYDRIDTKNISTKALGLLLNGKMSEAVPANNFATIYPFGFNISQKNAIDNALSHPLTIIEGPPGTGKTQTILNIISNAVIRGESVAVVSNNNSAIANILEKMIKNKVDFIVASLGNEDNKSKFIESQKSLPVLDHWNITTEEEKEIKYKIQVLSDSINKKLIQQNNLSKINREIHDADLEYKYFIDYFHHDDRYVEKYLKKITSNAALKLWLLCEKYAENEKKPGFIRQIINRFLHGVINKDFYTLPYDIMIGICQKRYYLAKITEISLAQSELKNELDSFNFNEKMKKYSELSMKLFHYELYKKYHRLSRSHFNKDDLRPNAKKGIAEKIIQEYPVILSTTHSLCNSLSSNFVYDYVIIDEASQVNLVTGSLALSCARKAVVVGDIKQLPHVVTSDIANKTDEVFKQFRLPESYRYKKHSILSSILETLPHIPRVMLREHYRCHPDIIGFCNQKFYNNQMIILTEPQSDIQPLIVYKTATGNHARNHVNQRQIDVINHEILPKLGLNTNTNSVGIVTPYRNQTETLQKIFTEMGIKADTVDKFQGRENDIIILSTVDNEMSKFADNPNRLNVAISRAAKQLIVIINGGNDDHETNVNDLIKYIEYNNHSIINSEIHSIFDLLYKSYDEIRRKILKKYQNVSKYDSENLMYGLICDVLDSDDFRRFDVSPQVPLRMIFRKTESLDGHEKTYVQNILTRVDFMIFDRYGRMPRLGIEVDGVSFHAKGTRQAERDEMKDNIFEKYEIPLIRFRTNESAERDRLISKLNEITSSTKSPPCCHPLPPTL